MRRITKLFFTALMVLWDFVSVLLGVTIAFKLRFGFVGDIPRIYMQNMWFYILITYAIVLIVNILLFCYSGAWRQASAVEVVKQVCSGVIVFGLLFVIDRFSQYGMPFEVLLLIALIVMILSILGRMSVKGFIYLRSFCSSLRTRKGMKRTLIYGAGEAGTHLLRKINSNPEEGLKPVAFLDDNENLWGLKINGLKVAGGGDVLEEIVRLEEITEIIVAIPTAEREFLKDLLKKSKALGCNLRRYGSIDDVSAADFDRAQIKQINLDELLRRDRVHLNMDIVRQFIANKTVLVTGGVGSIGSEICRQVLSFGAEKLIIFDINENGLFDINNELSKTYDRSRYELVLGSIRDRNRLNEVFDFYHPQIVFHAAAHKHVPMMEGNPKEAVKNNVFGTINLANCAIMHQAEKFILISTDKAVNPTNIMGASKRIAELVIQMMNQASDTEFAAVRFGNVLGSNGSVVPFFKKQIEAGGPVTVTHPDMRRYFMTIPEAVQLVLEAGAMADGGEIFVLDMGDPVKIYDLACDMIRLSGYEPEKDIKIIFTGLRPGEKLFEEISLKDEDTTKTPNNKIYINKPIKNDLGEFAKKVKKLQETLEDENPEPMFNMVQQIVETFHHNTNDPH